MSESDSPAPTFYIPSVRSGVERTRILKHGDTFAVFDLLGDLPGGDGGVEGIYHRDTRHLHYLRVRFGKQAPLFLSSHVQRNNARLNVDLANPDFWENGELILPRDSVHLGRIKFLWEGAAYEILTVRNFSGRRLHITLNIQFAADFRDIFEVRGLRRARRGALRARVEGDCRVRHVYSGLDGVERTTEIEFRPAPAELTTSEATFLLDLPRGGRQRISLIVRCNATSGRPLPVVSAATGVRRAHRARLEASRRFPGVETSDELFNEWLCRSTADLVMLTTDTPHGPYPYAGIPWFSTVFGRDGLITALQVLWANPEYARGVLRFLAAHQAQHTDPARDAEPGKILHELRQGEMALTGEVPFGAYYGSVDATPLFVWLMHEYLLRTADRSTVEQLFPHVERAVQWFDSTTDADGFLTYSGKARRGLRNQGWKDSEDAVFHADGRLAVGPIALVEVQGYLYAARRAAAALASALGKAELARVQQEKAERLRQNFERRFWLESRSFYALALDGGGEPCAVRTSNAGHLLLTELCTRERAEVLARELIAPHFFSGWGVRTVAAGEARYNPMSYHNGSIWPHDNALFAMGCARLGFQKASLEVFRALFDAATHMELRRLPELYCGFARRRDAGPTLYPVACSPQAWSAAVPWALLGAVLGIAVDTHRHAVVLRRPRLPGFLSWVRIRDLRVPGGTLTLLLRRAHRTVAVEVEAATGGLRVEVEP